MSPEARSWLGLGARLVVGATLVYAGAGKAAGPKEEFALVIASYQLLPRDMVATVAVFLPWAEVLLGWALLLGVFTRAAALASAGLFGFFLLALLSTVSRGIELPNCGCFGEGLHFTVPQALALDALMLGLCVAAALYGRRLSLDNWADGGYTPRR